MAEGTRLDFTILAQPYSPDKDEYIAVLHPVWTTANLADATHRVNTKDKFVGRMVWDSTLGEAVFASGAAAADPWYTAVEIGSPVVSTTAELVDKTDAINTVNKVAGKMVWDATKGQPVWADAALDVSTWSLSTGVVATTPA